MKRTRLRLLPALAITVYTLVVGAAPATGAPIAFSNMERYVFGSGYFEDPLSAPQFGTISPNIGNFTASTTLTPTGEGSFGASQNTEISQTLIGGSGSAFVAPTELGAGEGMYAESYFQTSFTLTEAILFIFSGTVEGAAGTGLSDTNGLLFSFVPTQGPNVFSVSGTLQPGEYFIGASAGASTFDGFPYFGATSSTFTATLRLGTTENPPSQVPEPAMALLLGTAGVALCRRMKRGRGADRA